MHLFYIVHVGTQLILQNLIQTLKNDFCCCCYCFDFVIASLTEPSPDQLDASVTVPDELFQSQDGGTSTPEVALFVVSYPISLLPLNESMLMSMDAIHVQVPSVIGATVISNGVEVTELSVPATLRFRVPPLASNVSLTTLGPNDVSNPQWLMG